MADNTAPVISHGHAGGRSVIAVLGPTNTGKTHLAIDRMLGHESGLIGLPLRLLAREVYDKIVARIGPAKVALITGEERIKPENPRYYVSTVEAMPRDLDVDFVAIDEIQLAADPERGHVFTERLLSMRGRSETLLLGASSMQETIRDLLPGTNFIGRHRFSKLTYAGQKKITRLPRRSAIVTFSAADVYAIAELVRRQRGGAAVVIGALSPRTRNAQVELYQSGDVDFLVATDAIGMGLNLDVDHVAFGATRKFDGRNHRELSSGELGQIAGRAGRHLNDGTFGVTGDVEPFAADVINRLESHEFENVKILQWRNTALDFGSLDRLKESLRQSPPSQRLTRARAADDVLALDHLSEDGDIRDIARAPAALRMLWDVCQVPDYRKISSANHAELVATLYKYLTSDAGVIPEDWLASQVDFANRTDGDIDTLSNRIAHIRTWTFVSNRQSWVADPEHWRQRTREIEDTLSDALHELLTQRFVDRRTSVLMKSMRDKDTLYADIENTGQIYVEKHYVGKLAGFRFTPDAAASGIHGKAARHAAAKVLASELAMRAERLGDSKDDAFQITRTGKVLWEKQEIGCLEAGEDPLRPVFTLTADEHLSQPDRERIIRRVQGWMNALIETRLKPLNDLARSQEVTGLARGIAFRIVENFGILPRDTVAGELRALDQQSRAELRKFGVRFGAYNIYFPLLLKPAAADLLLLLWALKNGASAGLDPNNLPEPPRQGLTSVPVDPACPASFYRAAGFQICGPRAVRIDMLERLADLIRPLSSWKPTESQPEPPAGAVGRGGFKVQPEMMSIMGCSAEELGNVLFSLGFRKERRPIPVKPVQEPVAAHAPASGEAQVAEAGGVEAASGQETGEALVPSSAEGGVAETAASEGSQAESAVPETTPGASTELVAAATAEPSVAAEAAKPHGDLAASEPADAQAEPQEPLVAAETPAPLVAAETAEPLVAAETAAPLVAAETAEPLVAAETAEPLVAAEAGAPLVAAETAEPHGDLAASGPTDTRAGFAAQTTADAELAPAALEAAEPASSRAETVEAGAFGSAEAGRLDSAIAISAVETAADATSAEAAALAADEQQFEEIWRPRRRGQGDERRPAHHRERGQDRTERQGNPAHRNRGPRPGERAAAAPVAAPSERAPQPQRADQQRGERRRDEHKRDDRNRDGGRGRDERRRDERKSGGGGGRPNPGPRTQTASPRPPKDRPANPDSPFAALMQLKEQLERRAQDQA